MEKGSLLAQCAGHARSATVVGIPVSTREFDPLNVLVAG